MRAAAIADDLTGALEIGALLAGHGYRTLVTRSLEHGEADAIVIDTDSRHLDPNEANAKVRKACQSLPANTPLFKKVDSTLRGNVASELAALPPDRPLIFTPAYPANGRTVVNGCLYIDGKLITETAFAHDPRSPITNAKIDPPALDASTDADLERIIAAAPPHAIFAGSGGLARAWRKRLPPGPPTQTRPTPFAHPLLVCGSRHPMSLAQAHAAAQLGVPVLLPPPGLDQPDAILHALASEAAQHQPDLLILFGGDTAAAVLARQGPIHLWPERELLPGIVLSRTAAALPVITKAGGFGTPNVVEQILRLLN